MKKISVYPKNKKKFLRLLKFAKEILDICRKVNVNPVVYGSLACFIYSKDKNMAVNDFDFLIPKNSFDKIIHLLNENKIIYHYSVKWHTIQIFNKNLKVELDSIEYWQKNLSNKFEYLNLNGLKIKIISLNDLTKIYRKLAKIGRTNRKKKIEKYLMLKNLK